MARTKATVMVDREKVHVASQLVGTSSMSDVLDVALDRLIEARQLERAVASYRTSPPTGNELAVTELPVEFDLGDDDVDYDELYGERVTDTPPARRGEVWFAEVPGDKRRPVLVLTRDPLGRILHSVICAPITSTIREIDTEVEVGTEVGLAHRSVANFDNTFLLARHRLIRRLGRARPETMEAACVALARATACTAPALRPRS